MGAGFWPARLEQPTSTARWTGAQLLLEALDQRRHRAEGSVRIFARPPPNRCRAGGIDPSHGERGNGWERSRVLLGAGDRVITGFRSKDFSILSATAKFIDNVAQKSQFGHGGVLRHESLPCRALSESRYGAMRAASLRRSSLSSYRAPPLNLNYDGKFRRRDAVPPRGGRRRVEVVAIRISWRARSWGSTSTQNGLAAETRLSLQQGLVV